MRKFAPEKLVSIRNQREMTAYRLAKRAQMSAGSLHDIESGRTKNPGSAALGAIAAVLECAIDDFFEDSEPAGGEAA